MTHTSSLKIAHVDTGRNLRGGQQQVLLLARGLRARGHDQLIACPEESALEARARSEGFRTSSLPAHDPWHAHGILLLRRQLQLDPCDVLHAHDGRGQTLAWLASLGMPARRIASRRVTFLPSARWTFRLKYAHTCHAVVAVSEFVKGLILSAGVPESLIEVIPDAVQIPVDVPPPQMRLKTRQRWGFEEQDFVMGHLGAFTPEKGQDIALEAFLRLQGQLPGARLVFVGEGPMLPSREVVVRIAQLQGHVRVLECAENIEEFFAGLDLYVMPSRAEGLGSSALEAMARGVPVVASRVGGLPEIVSEGVTGWLVAPGSPEALAEAILAAASDPARLRRLGSNARQRARDFSADIMLDRTEALYRRLVSGKPK